MKPKRKKLCPGWIASKRRAEKHTQKVFRRIDAENQKLDQQELNFD